MGLWVVTSVLVSALYLLPDAGPPGVAQADKLAHLIAFAAIGTTTWPAARHKTQFVILLAISAVLGIGLECLQAFVPSRHFSFLDMLANAVGLAIGAAAGRRLEGILTRLIEPRRL